VNAPIIPIDDFVSWNNFPGWWPRFEQQVLDPLLNGHPAHYQQRDWEGDELGDSLGPWTTVNSRWCSSKAQVHPPIETQAEFRAAGILLKLEGGR
jgi:hypothetical protein